MLLDTNIVIGIASFIGGSLTTISVASKWFMPRTECKSERCGCQALLKIADDAHKSEVSRVIESLTELKERQRLQSQMLLVIMQHMHIKTGQTELVE